MSECPAATTTIPRCVTSVATGSARVLTRTSDSTPGATRSPCVREGSLWPDRVRPDRAHHRLPLGCADRARRLVAPEILVPSQYAACAAFTQPSAGTAPKGAGGPSSRRCPARRRRPPLTLPGCTPAGPRAAAAWAAASPSASLPVGRGPHPNLRCHVLEHESRPEADVGQAGATPLAPTKPTCVTTGLRLRR